MKNDTISKEDERILDALQECSTILEKGISEIAGSIYVNYFNYTDKDREDVLIDLSNLLYENGYKHLAEKIP